MQRYSLISWSEVYTLSRFCSPCAKSRIANDGTKVMTGTSGLLACGFKHLQLIPQSYLMQQFHWKREILILETFRSLYIVMPIRGVAH